MCTNVRACTYFRLFVFEISLAKHFITAAAVGDTRGRVEMNG